MKSLDYSEMVPVEEKFSRRSLNAISYALTAIVSAPRSEENRVFCLLKGSSGQWVVGRNDRSATSHRWRKSLKDGTTLTTRHAEEHALELAQKKKIGTLKEAVVIRISKKGKPQMSRPCRTCETKLIKAGIPKDRIFFSGWDGEIEGME